MATIKMIKNDASAEIKISAGFLQKLQKVMFALVADKSDEEIQLFKQEIDSQKDNLVEKQIWPTFSEEWMDNIFTITTIIGDVESAFIANGFVYDKEIDETIIQQDNLYPDQSQSQPE